MRLLCTALILVTVFPAYGQEEKKPASELNTHKEKLSYAIGMNIGRQVNDQDLDIDPALLAAALLATLKGEDAKLTNSEMQEIFAEDGKRRVAKREAQVKENLANAEKFLADNLKKKGVKKTESGLQYVVLKAGTGATPKENHRVYAHYRGTFMDGKKFDSSYEGDSPTETDKAADFPVTGVIPGWTEALQLMKVGAKYRLFIHPKLAYGVRGRGGIPPNSLLIFDIELVKTEAEISLK